MGGRTGNMAEEMGTDSDFNPLSELVGGQFVPVMKCKAM
jgi:hypothetical protein